MRAWRSRPASPSFRLTSRSQLRVALRNRVGGAERVAHLFLGGGQVPLGRRQADPESLGDLFELEVLTVAKLDGHLLVGGQRVKRGDEAIAAVELARQRRAEVHGRVDRAVERVGVTSVLL